MPVMGCTFKTNGIICGKIAVSFKVSGDTVAWRCAEHRLEGDEELPGETVTAG